MLCVFVFGRVVVIVTVLFCFAFRSNHCFEVRSFLLLFYDISSLLFFEESFVPSTDDEITEMAISLAESPEYLCEKNLESFISKYPKDYTNSMTSLCENKKRNVFDFELKGFEVLFEFISHLILIGR